MDDRIVVSFGGGVQSSTLAVLALDRHRGFIDACGGLPARWVFADTGAEPQAVYRHVEKMRGLLVEGGFEFVTVKRQGGGLADQLKTHPAKQAGQIAPPMFISTIDGRSTPMRRGCTSRFKVRPINAQLSRWFGRRLDPPVVEVLGISADEAQRMKISDRPGLSFLYPLVMMGWKREHCRAYLEGCGIDAPRSACSFCPFHSPNEWRRLKAEPAEWDRIVAFEKMIHARYDSGGLFGVGSKPYLHPSRVPIDEVDFDRQLSLWSMDDECAGVCGV